MVEKHTTELELVKAALDDGLDLNCYWGENVFVNIQPESIHMMRAYVEDSNTWPHYNTPLYRAIHYSDFGSAKLMLEHGVYIDLYNAIGLTPLHEAVWNHNHDAIRFLLTHGADIDKTTIAARVWSEDAKRDIHGSEGDLNVQRALHVSGLTSLKLLVEAGADLCPWSQYLWTALDLALLYGD
jgi:hypothetical protein